ncbi:hypothetical protein ACFV2Z_01265 [Streptomyces sp. NPDC059688]|uniref:hypothetical protein n=1 Tax=Streptomyces sp. NPDC059688 TaxID=3346906 RepID=UPI00367F018F
MQACGCMNPIEMVARLAGYGLVGLAAVVLGLVCLIAVLLAAIVVLGGLVRRRSGAVRTWADGAADEEPAGLASFRWHSGPDR